VNLIDTVMFHASTTFLNYGISESVDEVGKVDIAGSAVRGSTNSRHLVKAMMIKEVWGTRPSYLT
jgi:hypothetical protein